MPDSRRAMGCRGLSRDRATAAQVGSIYPRDRDFASTSKIESAAAMRWWFATTPGNSGFGMQPSWRAELEQEMSQSLSVLDASSLNQYIL